MIIKHLVVATFIVHIIFLNHVKAQEPEFTSSDESPHPIGYVIGALILGAFGTICCISIIAIVIYCARRREKKQNHLGFL